MKRNLTILLLIVFAGILLVLAAGFTYGTPLASDMDDYFIRFGQAQIAANNIVTTIVFDYRGFDTLGESTVLFTAVIGVSLMFRRFFGGEDDADE
jgi:multisubunit Na+/H+ antiporter MnhB subunit